jgi:hypothetical protein
MPLRPLSDGRTVLFVYTVHFVCATSLALAQSSKGASDSGVRPREELRRFVSLFCAECHNSEDKAGGLALDELSGQAVGDHSADWEKVVRKLAARQMPPPEALRPKFSAYESALALLGKELDQAAKARPNPGRTETFRRLNRTEYRNAIRDLLALDIDVSALLPNDESSRGFDNLTVGELSPTLLERYITAAQKISRLAMGGATGSPSGDTFRVRPDVTQEEHVEGLPIGTRGGTRITYNFPRDGHYEFQARLTRDRNENVEGLREPHEMEFLLDGERRAIFTVQPPKNEGEHQTADLHLKAKFKVAAGPHEVGVTFLKYSSSLLETKHQPYQAHYNMHRHPRITPALFQVSINGPYDALGPGDTPSRRRVLVCHPRASAEEDTCAKQILQTFARRAFRRPVSESDLGRPLELYRQSRANADFDAGIEMALAAILVSPRFLFRIETDPPGAAPGSVYRLPDLELASRLSFFIWSSIPDDELLDAAERGALSQPEVLERQVRRMLADPRSNSLVTNFADQWLHLRNLDSITPDLRQFPDFDDNLRQAFRRETELLFESVLREDRSVLDLLKPNETFLNERLARHYGIPHVTGSRFRRLTLTGGSVRGGLLRQGSILTVTSYATRTSPVIRGKWVLENIVGTPPPPPPANVPALKDNTIDSSLSVRERLSEHRKNPACAGCHKLIDPVGFALENFDAVGRWRTTEEGRPVDTTGGLPDGSTFDGVAGLEAALLKRPELFVGALTEKLLTFALGRGVESYDGPAVRKIVSDAKTTNYRLSSLVLGIAQSVPIQMRRAE